MRLMRNPYEIWILGDSSCDLWMTGDFVIKFRRVCNKLKYQHYAPNRRVKSIVIRLTPYEPIPIIILELVSRIH